MVLYVQPAHNASRVGSFGTLSCPEFERELETYDQNSLCYKKVWNNIHARSWPHDSFRQSKW